ncbi:zinc metalloproteinase nas-14-like [Bacillus rossius redtenbacheri]|uniref:zinc metalloproteinase nas-14-like n=1 Tax=Bacillus rossius redtenbacheri TaxID=93214 RepID=UPI002FDDD5A6
MRQLTRRLCVRFVERTDERHYVAVGKRRELGCSSVVGRQPDASGGQTLNLRSPECLQQAGVIQHELLHALGLMHEQARPDRDGHVRVLWENIHPDYKSDFEKAPEEYVSTYGVPYDYASIMHYPNNAFSKNKKNTIIAKDNPNLQLGQRNSPTEKDLEKVRRMYNCASS